MAAETSVAAAAERLRAATNVLLIIVTLGIYRFWATARQRRYLWSRTEVIGDRLEWTGTGKEMFIGFLIVMAVLLPFFLFIQFLFPAMVARGKEGAAVGIIGLFYIGLIYLGGFARFRALRYRLSRSWWRGDRERTDGQAPQWNPAAPRHRRFAHRPHAPTRGSGAHRGLRSSTAAFSEYVPRRPGSRTEIAESVQPRPAATYRRTRDRPSCW